MRYILSLAAFLWAFHSPAQLEISELEDSVYIVTTYGRYGETLYPANSMYVLTEKGAILIDTPWDTTQVLPLIDSIKVRHNADLVFCLATHFHGDRTDGFNIMREAGVETWSSQHTYELCIERQHPLAEHTFSGDTTFVFGSLEFETYFPGAGHAPDNIVVWFPKYDLLYGGCFVKSVEAGTLGNLGDADPVSWAAAVKKVQKRYKKPSYIIPGHQEWLSRNSLTHTLKLLKTGK